MAVEITLKPGTDRGREILDDLEGEISMGPTQVLDDGTRVFRLEAEDATVDDLDRELQRIDSEWQDHITNAGGGQVVS